MVKARLDLGQLIPKPGFNVVIEGVLNGDQHAFYRSVRFQGLTLVHFIYFS